MVIINDMSPESANLRFRSEGAVATIRFDRPDLRNALTDEVLAELVEHLQRLDRDPAVRCVVLAGSDEVFVSGADIRALLARDAIEVYAGQRARDWAALRSLSTPTVAAVSGFCLGGGFELAMSADVVVASPTARFGLPETGLGLIPGAGGTQMLTRLVGKAVAMDMLLSGRILGAEEAERRGVVSRIGPAEGWLELAEEVAAEIAGRPAVAQRMAREAARASFEMPLAAGIEAERKAFAMAFASEDAREGMTAFIEKRDPEWRHR